MQMEIFDMQAVQDRVKESIQGAFAAMIPDEMWQGLIARETETFMSTTLPSMIQNELQAQARAHIKEALMLPEFSPGLYTPSGYLPGEIAQEITRQLAPELVQAMFGNIVQTAVMQMRNQFQQQRF